MSWKEWKRSLEDKACNKGWKDKGKSQQNREKSCYKVNENRLIRLVLSYLWKSTRGGGLSQDLRARPQEKCLQGYVVWRWWRHHRRLQFPFFFIICAAANRVSAFAHAGSTIRVFDCAKGARWSLLRREQQRRGVRPPTTLSSYWYLWILICFICFLFLEWRALNVCSSKE